jgi:hypothetical protein
VHPDTGAHTTVPLCAEHDIDGIYRRLRWKHLPQSCRAPVADDAAVAREQRGALTRTGRAHRPELVNARVHATQQPTLCTTVNEIAGQAGVQQLFACQQSVMFRRYVDEKIHATKADAAFCCHSLSAVRWSAHDPVGERAKP